MRVAPTVVLALALTGCGSAGHAPLIRRDATDPAVQYRWTKVTCREFRRQGAAYYAVGARSIATDPAFTTTQDGRTPVDVDRATRRAETLLRVNCAGGRNPGYRPVLGVYLRVAKELGR